LDPGNSIKHFQELFRRVRDHPLTLRVRRTEIKRVVLAFG